jgi:hypothetical protein
VDTFVHTQVTGANACSYRCKDVAVNRRPHGLLQVRLSGPHGLGIATLQEDQRLWFRVQLR